MTGVAMWRLAIVLVALLLLASPGFADGRRVSQPVNGQVSGIFASFGHAWGWVLSFFAEGRGGLDPLGGDPNPTSNTGADQNGATPPPDPDRGPRLDPWG